MEQVAMFGEMTKDRAEYLFKLPPDALFRDPRMPAHLRQLMIDVLDQPYVPFMLSERRAIHGTPYSFIIRGEEIADHNLRHTVLKGFNFAWHLMGGAWVMEMVKNLGMIFATYFIAEAYEQFYITFYQRYVMKEVNPTKMYAVVDDYLVVILANMQANFRKEVAIHMIGRVLQFMAATVDQTQAFCQRVNVVTQHINYNHTLH
jgi:hypothetical protein